MADTMRDYLEKRVRELEARVRELEALAERRQEKYRAADFLLNSSNSVLRAVSAALDLPITSVKWDELRRAVRAEAEKHYVRDKS